MEFMWFVSWDDGHWALIKGVLYKICAVPKVDRFHDGGCKDLSVVAHGCGSGNPYHVRIVKSIRNIGPSLMGPYMQH